MITLHLPRQGHRDLTAQQAKCWLVFSISPSKTTVPSVLLFRRWLALMGPFPFGFQLGVSSGRYWQEMGGLQKSEVGYLFWQLPPCELSVEFLCFRSPQLFWFSPPCPFRPSGGNGALAPFRCLGFPILCTVLSIVSVLPFPQCHYWSEPSVF